MHEVIERIRQANELKANKTLEDNRQTQTELSAIAVQETILKAFKSLVEYMDGATTKTQVVNQLREIGTPDAMKVVSAVEDLHATIKSRENTDLTEVTEVMKEVLAEAKQIPKDHQTIDLPEPIDYGHRFENLESKVDKLITVLEGKETVVQAPEVNVAAPEVKINTDTKPLAKEMTKAIDSLKDGQPEVVDGAVQTQDISGLVTEKFNKFNITYAHDDFDDSSEGKIGSIQYYLGKKKVATLKFAYNSDGELKGVEKV